MRSFLILVLGAIALSSASQVDAAEFKLATVAPEGSQWMQQLRAAAGAIKDRTQGRAIVKLYGGGVMGNEKQVLRKMRIGQLQGGAFTASGIAERYPDIVVYGLPLLFDSQAEVDYVRSKLDAKLAQGLEQAGLVSFGFAGGGFARIFANRPIAGTADMRGQKIWVPEGDRISAAAMEALHLAPVSLPVTDVMTGLQTGLVDVVAAPPVGVIALQWHTRVKHMTRVPLMYTMGMLAVDAGAFGRLNPADQASFRSVMEEVYHRLDERSGADDAAALEALQASGIKFVDALPADTRQWREAVATANRKLGEQGVYTPALLAEVQSHLQQYRRQQGKPVATPAGP